MIDRKSPSTTRSATTVPVAAAIEIFPFSRSMYGRTISPMRKGIRRMAANPIHETASTRFRDTSAKERRRNRHRTARK